MSVKPNNTYEGSFKFLTKAQTLARLSDRVSCATFCEQAIVDIKRWRQEPSMIVAEICTVFAGQTLVVRSSAASEDAENESLAGAHLSLIGIAAEQDDVRRAIMDVFASYLAPSDDDEVLVQPFIENVALSGVVTTRDLDTGGPYFVINYDDLTGRTDTVTGGAASKSVMVHRSHWHALKSERLRTLIASIIEIEKVTGFGALDIEFCITKSEVPYILQVRPLAARRNWDACVDTSIDESLDFVRAEISASMKPSSFILGETTIFSEMSDWNPAEMIGNHPRPLAYSLYERLITQKTWAEARRRMGYRIVDQPLMTRFRGRPFIDVRASLNSFLPAELDESIGKILANHQLEILGLNPNLHDKIEFDVAITCRDFAFEKLADKLLPDTLSANDIAAFEGSLHRLTTKALLKVGNGLRDLVGECESLLSAPPANQLSADIETVDHILCDAVTSGTLPFSILARHGFIAVSLLRSLTLRDVLDDDGINGVLRNVHTVASDVVNALRAVNAGSLPLKTFLAQYGHLRPGTYDILSPRYDEQPDLFLGAQTVPALPSSAPVELSVRTMKDIDKLAVETSLGLDATTMFNYIRQAIAAREMAKFSFTRNISDALALLTKWGDGVGFDKDDISYLRIEEILATEDFGKLREKICERRLQSAQDRLIRLPSVIVEPSDIDIVRLPIGQPTFITNKSVTAKATFLSSFDATQIDGRIIMIESADPGFDWIFSHNLAGLITKYGGANSHMAIRCAEFGLPAAIGCGERLFDMLCNSSLIDLDAAQRRLTGHG